MEITEELKQRVWERGIISDKYPSTQVRTDACGAFMVYSHFGDRNSPFGWEIDHICPASYLLELGIDEELIDNIDNLRPLNWKNNVSKSNDYPFYTAVCAASDDQSKNVEINEGKVVNANVQARLTELYNLN